MRYFFDESGNWMEVNEENKNLVIGGIVVKNEEDFDFIKREVSNFKLERGIREIHANEMSELDRELFLKIIDKLLEENKFKALLYIINPNKLIQTQKEADEIYADIASDLVVEIAAGDEELEIEYDMKFYYAYPLQIIDNIEKRTSSYEFNRMKSNFYLKEDKFHEQKKRILRILSSSKNITNLYELKYKLNNRGFLFNYLWEEFRLNIEKASIIREKFKEKIITKTSEFYKQFGIDKEIKVNIAYKGKHNQSAGVQIVDFLTNIVRFHGKNPRYFKPYIVKDIYQKISIKEIL